VPVPNRGQRLHAKKERFQERIGRYPGNAVSSKTVKGGKDEIERDVDDGDKGAEPRPGQAKQPLVSVAPIETFRVDLNEFDLPGSLLSILPLVDLG
jgi:hypothetical protein